MVNITEAPVNGIIKLGKPLELTCTATGVPTPAIIWKKLDDGASPDPNIITVRHNKNCIVHITYVLLLLIIIISVYCIRLRILLQEYQS